tara:strand:- start:8006 stop:9241 length:1236 start_codon:yes stop_codon:yes gene_type:complete
MIRLSTRGALAGLLLVASAATGFAQDGNTTYVTANDDAQVRSFHDPKGALVSRLDGGTLMKVHSTSTGSYPYYEVEVAGGMPVWVHGSLLAETATANVLRVTGSNVLMRPLPESSRKAMPLPSKLQLGTRVEMLGRHDVAKPMADDWIQILSPEGARGWVMVNQTSTHADAAGAAAAWTQARVALPSEPAKTVPTNNTSNSNGARPTVPAKTKPVANVPVPDGAVKALADADKIYDAVKVKSGVTAMEVEPALTAYQKVLNLAPASSTTYQVAERRLAQAEILYQIAMLNDREMLRDQQNQARITELNQKEADRIASQHPNWGRFNGRGWLEKDEGPGKPTRWYLRWSGERKVEVLSSSGRYDLSNYEGYQIGIQGTTRREATAVTLETDAQLRLLDVFKIEVISGGRASR